MSFVGFYFWYGSSYTQMKTWTRAFYSHSLFFFKKIAERRGEKIQERQRGAVLVTNLVLSFLPCTSRVRAWLIALFRVSYPLSYLSWHSPWSPILKSPNVRLIWKMKCNQGERFLFIGIVEKQLPTAMKQWVSAEPFYFFDLILSPPVFLSMLFFSFTIICLAT